MGGLIGANYGPVTDSFDPVYNADDQGGDEVGGLVGSNEPDGSISRCYSIGQVVVPRILAAWWVRTPVP